MTELLNCPFCGSPASIEQVSNDDSWWIIRCTDQADDAAMACSACPEVQEDNREIAIAHWNHREPEARSALADVGECDAPALEPLHREALERIEPVPHIATLINNNQPGWTNIIETAPNVTIDVGTKLYDQKALFAVGVAMLEEGRKGGYEDGYIVGKAFQKHFADKAANGITGEHAAAGMPDCTGKQPRPAAEVCPYCGAPEHAPRCCQESPAAEVEVCGECGKRWSCCPHGDKSCVLHHPPSPAAEELYQCLCGAVFRKGKEAREHDCYAATRPAAHTAQLTEDEREALERGALCLEHFAEYILQDEDDSVVYRAHARELRRLASTAERE